MAIIRNNQGIPRPHAYVYKGGVGHCVKYYREGSVKMFDVYWCVDAPGDWHKWPQPNMAIAEAEARGYILQTTESDRILLLHPETMRRLWNTRQNKNVLRLPT